MMEVTGRSFHKVDFDTADPAEAILRFRNLVPGATVETVGAGAFVALCEVCGKPIFEGETYETDEDAYLCGECCGACSEAGGDADELFAASGGR